jgi:hypothetical protein
MNPENQSAEVLAREVERLKRWLDWHRDLNRDLVDQLRGARDLASTAAEVASQEAARRLNAEARALREGVQPPARIPFEITGAVTVQDGFGPVVVGAPPLHLWWNGEDYAPGATAEEAQRWLTQESGELPEKCIGPRGWHQVPDDRSILIEEERTPQEIARGMLKRAPLREEESPLAS